MNQFVLVIYNLQTKTTYMCMYQIFLYPVELNMLDRELTRLLLKNGIEKYTPNIASRYVCQLHA